VDSAMADRSIWTALQFAGHYKLKKLLVVFDLNGPDSAAKAMAWRKQLSSYGFSDMVVDGHCCEKLSLVSPILLLIITNFSCPVHLTNSDQNAHLDELLSKPSFRHFTKPL
jgi:hypothetical protein